MTDRVTIAPGRLAGTVSVPGDKSQSHRALMIGALVEGGVTLEGLAPSGDVLSTAGALRTLGATVELRPAADGNLSGRVEGPLTEAVDVIDCGNSGTGLRLLAGLVAGVPGLAVLTGDVSLRARPVDRVMAPLRALGVDVAARGDRLPPLVVHGGRVRAADYESPVASAQVKSCVLLAGLAADGPVSVTSPLASRDHTERMLRHLGLVVTTVEHDDGREEVRLEPGSPKGRALGAAGDPSSAAFWFVAAALPGGPARGITVHRVLLNARRTGVLRILRAMGANIEISNEIEAAGESVGDVTVTPGDLQGAEVAGGDVVDAIDELPVLALAGAASDDGLTVRDAAELRVKESDRISVLASQLGALGLTVDEFPDGFQVPGGQRPRGGQVDAHHDHRIAMTAAIAATFGTGEVDITGFDAVATSYPSFLDDLRSLGGAVVEQR